MGRLEDYYQSQAGLQQNGNTQQPVGSIVLPTLDTTNPIGSLAELLGPTPAEREAQERRMMQNRSKMQAWMGLFDGLRQLGNLYYATKGATPQTYNNPYQLVDNEIQQQRQIRDGITNYKRQYATSLYNLQRQMDHDRMQKEAHESQLSYRKQQEETMRERTRQQEEYNNARNEYYKARAAGETEKARYWELRADGVPAESAAKIAKDESAAQKNIMQGNAAVIRANNTGRGGRGNAGTTKVTTTGYDENGNKVVTTTTQPNGSSGNGKYDQYIQPNSSSSSNKWDKRKVQR